MVDDYWIETELKLKGADLRERHSLSWSYGIGVKIHFNEEIRDVLYLSIKRNRIDFTRAKINPILRFFIHDSEQEFKIDFDLKEFYKGKVTRLSFLFGKNFPIGNGNVTLSIAMGVMKIFMQGYTGSLDDQIDRSWGFLLRPNFHVKFD